MTVDRAFWTLFLSYPIIFAFADDRSVYSDQPNAVATNHLGTLGVLIQVTICLLAGGLALTRLLGQARDHQPIPTVLPFVVLLFATTTALGVAKGEPGVAFGAVVACAVLAAVALTPDPPSVVLGRIRTFLRVEILVSLALGVMLPSWALVPAWHNSREFFGIGSRLIGLTAGPNYMGATAAVLFILEVYIATRGHFLRGMFALLAFIAVLWSQSRTALVVTALACLLLVLVRVVPPRGWDAVVRIFIWTPILAMPVIPFFFLWLADSSPEMTISFTTGRVFVWQAGVEAISTAPIVGLTHAEFDAAMQKYSSFEFSNAHNQLLETWATGGVVMAILLLLLLLVLGRSLFLQSRVHLAPLALSFGVLGQLPFGTPFRLSGVTWNLVAVAILILCTLPWVAPGESRAAPVPASSKHSQRERPAARTARREVSIDG